jgi:LacI family transcriptional regulator
MVVPDDIAVMGIDGLTMGRAVTPELSTLSIDKAEIARAAVELLDRALGAGGGGDAPEVARVPLTLTLRQSA